MRNARHHSRFLVCASLAASAPVADAALRWVIRQILVQQRLERSEPACRAGQILVRRFERVATVLDDVTHRVLQLVAHIVNEQDGASIAVHAVVRIFILAYPVFAALELQPGINEGRAQHRTSRLNSWWYPAFVSSPPPVNDVLPLTV